MSRPDPPHRFPKRKRQKWRKPDLSVPQILEWVDAFFHHTGRFPNRLSGKVQWADETWCAIDQALMLGLRGLSGGRSLAKLLALHRGFRNRGDLPKLTERQIVEWAELYFRETGDWPTANSGDIPGHPGETWYAINAALRHGSRGLPGETSLLLLLANEGLMRHPRWPPTLSVKMIRSWAEQYLARHGKWPSKNCGVIEESPQDSWKGIDASLRKGKRGLPAGSSLARLLHKPRSAGVRQHIPDLTEAQIIEWAKAHFQRTGKWPKSKDGPIENVPGETWVTVEHALRRGQRGLSPGSSLARFLAAQGLKRNHMGLPPLTLQQIIRWADTFYQRHHEWPRLDSGVVDGCPQETWKAIDTALVRGLRGLPGGSSLTAFLNEHRGIYKGKSRRPKSIPESKVLRVEDILNWAKAHRQRSGRWPKRTDGSVLENPNVTWVALDSALRRGDRGLPGGSSLSILFREVE